MFNLNGITDFVIEPVNYISNVETLEGYFSAYIIKDGIEGIGIGDTEDEAIISAIDDIETIKFKSYKN